MLTSQQRQKIVEAVYSVPELYGVQIGYYGDAMCSSLAEGFTPSVNYPLRAVIIEETPPEAVSTTPRELPTPSPTFISNRSHAGSELLGAGLSCTFAVISGVGVLGSAAAEVPSAGTSTFVLVVAWAGFVTSGVQCLNGIARVGAIAANPDGNTLQQWDSNKIYTSSLLVVDLIGVAGGIASLPQATRNLMAILERRGGLAAGQALQQMNRAERAAAIQEAVRQASRNPETAQLLEQALKEAGALRQATTAGGASVRIAEDTMHIVSRETARRLTRAVMDVIGAAGGPIASGLPGSWVGPASGSVNAIGGLVLSIVPIGS